MTSNQTLEELITEYQTADSQQERSKVFEKLTSSQGALWRAIVSSAERRFNTRINLGTVSWTEVQERAYETCVVAFLRIVNRLSKVRQNTTDRCLDATCSASGNEVAYLRTALDLLATEHSDLSSEEARNEPPSIVSIAVKGAKLENTIEKPVGYVEWVVRNAVIEQAQWPGAHLSKMLNHAITSGLDEGLLKRFAHAGTDKLGLSWWDSSNIRFVRGDITSHHIQEFCKVAPRPLSDYGGQASKLTDLLIDILDSWQEPLGRASLKQACREACGFSFLSPSFASLDAALEAGLDFPSDSELPFQVDRASWLAQEGLREAFDKLPELQQEVIYQQYNSPLTLKQIAERMGRTYVSIRATASRAEKTLKLLLVKRDRQN